jgi:hypothetical protein
MEWVLVTVFVSLKHRHHQIICHWFSQVGWVCDDGPQPKGLISETVTTRWKTKDEICNVEVREVILSSSGCRLTGRR